MPGGLTINPATGVILGSSPLAGSFDVMISASNATGTSSKMLTLNFTPQPAPVINSPLDVTALISTVFSYQITATNFANTFTAQGTPSWLGFDPATGTFSGTPTAAGSSDITITASNLGGTDTEILHIDVITDPLAAALDTKNLFWDSSVAPTWSATSATSHDGVDSAQAGPIGDDQNAWVSTTVAGPGHHLVLVENEQPRRLPVQQAQLPHG